MTTATDLPEGACRPARRKTAFAGWLAPYRYHIENEWRVKAKPEEIADILKDAEGLTRWWPAVFRDARLVHAGGQHQVGRVVDVQVRGWMPHSLRFRFEVVRADPTSGFEVRAMNDLAGRGSCRYRVEGDSVVMRWTLHAEVRHLFVRTFSWLFHRVFVSNHAWAMATGVESLAYELERRRAPERAHAVPPPPAPTLVGRGGFARLLAAPARMWRAIKGASEGVRFAREMAA